MGPVLQYAETFVKSAIDPAPPAVPLLTMIRLNEAAFKEVELRRCPPLETFLLNLRMSMWPVLQKEMSAHVDSLKTLADSAGGSFLMRGNVRDSIVQAVAHRYAILFASMLALIEDDDEPMLFTNLTRLRQELVRLITSQASKARDPTQAAAYQSTMYESLLQTLSVGPRPIIHPRAQMETAFWREREEEARRRLASTRG